MERGSFYLNLNWLETWLSETATMNGGKVGQPFLYPESLIRFLGMLYAKGFTYRDLQGILTSLSKRLGPFPVIAYSQIRRRIKALNLTFAPLPDDAVVGIDGSGLKVSNRGEWIRHKWAVRRGWVKLVLMGATNGDIIDVRVGIETLNEIRAARGLLTEHQPRTVLLDSLHDVKDTYTLCHQNKITLHCPARKNARNKGMTSRARAVREQQQLGKKEWSKQYGYGHRWVATEGVFSAVKRIFGEELRSHNKKDLYHEARLKCWAYQTLRTATTQT